MTLRNIEQLFKPKSIVVIGASERPGSIGRVVMQNLLAAGFPGTILPLNPHYKFVNGIPAYASVADLPMEPDLAVVCTPSHVVPDILRELVAKNARCAIVLSAAPPLPPGMKQDPLAAAVAEAKRSGLRILGPNCLGVAAPGYGLNATFAHLAPRRGSLALVTQSGAIGTAILDWAEQRQLGFSYFVSLGNTTDIDVDDLLDYISADSRVSGILLYIEGIAQARNFMSAARAAARGKVLIALKSGRFSEGARAAATHSGAVAGADDVYDAAFRRAGILRVHEIDELFDAAETLALVHAFHGKRLLILTNGGGPGVMAIDELIAGGGTPARLATEHIKQLDAVLPAAWSHDNPIDIIGDATPDRYKAALDIVLEWDNFDALLVMNVPTAVADSVAAAHVTAKLAGGAQKTVITNWLGGETAEQARRVFNDARIPTYATPEKAVRAFLHMVRYRENQAALMETPTSFPAEPQPRVGEARNVIQQALEASRSMLSDPESRAVCSAYGIPVAASVNAAGPHEAAAEATKLGFPVALKIYSPEISHKSDVGGVALNLESAVAVQEAAVAMLARVQNAQPGAAVHGFTVQQMVRRSNAVELLIGAKTDPVFGPVIVFGQGGSSVEIVHDVSIELPPLSHSLAAGLVGRTRVSKLLHGYRDKKPVKLEAIYQALNRISQLMIDIPQVVELDINPLFADTDGVLALDARIRIAPASGDPLTRLAIKPYPAELEESVRLKNGLCVLLRPIRPEDEPAHQEFFQHLAPEDVYFRFFGVVRRLEHKEMARFTQIDYDREMAFIAVANQAGRPTLGVARAMADPDKRSAEFAIIVRSDVKGQGLGRILLNKLIRYCKDTGLEELTGQVKYENKSMLGLAASFGFIRAATNDPGIIEVRLPLNFRQAAVGAGA